MGMYREDDSIRVDTAKRWTYFLGAIFIDIALAWYGIQLLRTSQGTFSHTQLLIFGLITTTGGICLFTLPGIKRAWPVGVLLTAIGFYAFARAAGTITQPWLAHILGVGCWIGVFILLYATWPTRKRASPTNAPGQKTR